MREIYPLYQTDYDEMHTCSFDIVYGFNNTKNTAQMNVLKRC